MPDKKLIKVFDTSLNLLGIVDDYENASYDHRFYNAGPWTVTINKNLPNASLFAKKRIVLFGDNMRDCGIVTSIKKKIGKGGKGTEELQVSGFDPRYLLSQRVVYQSNDVDCYYLSDKAETVIKTLIDSQCGPSCIDAKRIFPLLQIATDQARGSDYELTAKGTQVYSECVTCAKESFLGWFLYLDLDNKKMILDCEEGTTRTVLQSVVNPVVISADRNSLSKGETKDSLASFRNLVYVAGAGAGVDREIYTGYTGTEPEGADRFEMFDDAGNLTTAAALAKRAVTTLQQNEQDYEISATIPVESPFVYTEDYREGDLVTVRLDDTDYNVRILEVSESWDEKDYLIEAVIGKPIKGLTEQVESVRTTIDGDSATSESGTNVSGMRNGIMTYDLTLADATMQGNECIYTVIEITGIMDGDRTFTFYFDSTRKFGRKIYNLILSVAAKDATDRVLDLTAGVNTISCTITLNSSRLLYQVWVDDDGNLVPDTPLNDL